MKTVCSSEILLRNNHLSGLDNVGGIFPRNVWNHLPDYTVPERNTDFGTIHCYWEWSIIRSLLLLSNYWGLFALKVKLPGREPDPQII